MLQGQCLWHPSQLPTPYDETEIGSRHYELSNHLQNVLVTVSDKKIPVDNDGDGITDWYEVDVVTANDYYSGGMQMPGREYSTGSSYQYGFGGKRKDNDIYGEGNAYDFGARIQDPRLGRWLSLDPLQKKYPGESNYAYVSNSPIAYSDLDGRDKIITINRTYDLGNGNSITLTRIKVIKGEYLKYEYYDAQKGAMQYNYYDQRQSISEYYDVNGKKESFGADVTATAGLSFTSEYDLDRPIQKAKYKFFKWARSLSESHEGDRDGGGIMFTSKTGEGTDKGPKSKFIDASPESIDLLVESMSQLKTTIDAGVKAKDVFEAIERTVVGGLEAGENTKNLIEKVKKETTIEQCESCKDIKKNGKQYDTTGKGIKSSDIKQVPIKDFHN